MEQIDVVFIDPGHGSLNPITGEYTTAPNKQFFFEETGEWFYEGEWNRRAAALLTKELIYFNPRLTVVNVAHPFLDTPLSKRVSLANKLASQSFVRKSIYVSLHANASKHHNASGWEIFAHPSSLISRDLAQQIALGVKSITHLPELSHVRVRGNDKMQLYKTANFVVLRNTKMPAVLIEHGFFDNSFDVQNILNNKFVLTRIIKKQATMIDFYLTNKMGSSAR